MNDKVVPEVVLHNALIDLKNRVKNNEKIDFGICLNVEHYVYKAQNIEFPAGVYRYVHQVMCDLFRMWPKYSGVVDYPVPDPERDRDIDPEDMFWETKDYWVGEYGVLRKELLDFMINEIENTISNFKKQ